VIAYMIVRMSFPCDVVNDVRSTTQTQPPFGGFSDCATPLRASAVAVCCSTRVPEKRT
jgi:hypothetical protein